MSRTTRATAFKMLAVWLLLLGPAGASYATNLSPVVDRLSSASAGDRVAALRDLGRFGLSPRQVRTLVAPLADDVNASVRLELVRTIEQLLGASGVDLLERLSKDRDREVRAGAIRAACRMWDRPPPKGLCVGAFRSSDSNGRVEVLRALSQHFARDPVARALFRRGLSDPSPLVQRAAVFGCQAARDPAAVDDLLRVAQTAPDVAAIPAAQEALPTIAGPAAIQALLSLLPRPEPVPGGVARPSANVRAAAAIALARLRLQGAASEIRALLAENDVTVLLSAIDALHRLHDRDSVAAISGLLTHRDVRVRRLALRALRNIGDPSSAESVRRVMTLDPEPIVRASAVLTYADVLGRRAIPALSRLRNDPEVIVRLEAAGALAGMGRPACNSLAGFVRDNDIEVRALAVSGIGQTRDASQIPVLASAAQSRELRNLRVRVEVAKALGSIGDPRGLPLLFRLAKDESPNVRANAASSLGRIGGADTVQILKRLSRDPAPVVRIAAFNALRRVDSEPR